MTKTSMPAGLWIHRGRRRLRSILDGSLLGRVIVQARYSYRDSRSRIRFVAATRMSEHEFWHRTLLGKRLHEWRNIPDITTQIAFENSTGLSTVYNKAIQSADNSEIIVFIHDDAWLMQDSCLSEIRRGLQKYEVLGVAGNQRRFPGQQTWYLRVNERNEYCLDRPHLSGAVRYGSVHATELNQFGPWPAECELLDGVFLAARVDVLRRVGLHFDEQFDFHFYDLDFCRAARAMRLKIGTWPIQLLHGSRGNPGEKKWEINFKKYIGKWGE